MIALATRLICSRITGNSLSIEDVLALKKTDQSEPAQTPSQPASVPPADESRTLTFAELKELIEQGKTDQIPNNRLIPDAIHVSTHHWVY